MMTHVYLVVWLQTSNNNNCDLSFEVLELPEFDFTGQSNMWILFDFYHDKNWGGGDASVEVSIDGGATWEDFSTALFQKHKHGKLQHLT